MGRDGQTRSDVTNRTTSIQESTSGIKKGGVCTKINDKAVTRKGVTRKSELELSSLQKNEGAQSWPSTGFPAPKELIHNLFID